jgi:hypothetical protein
MKDFIKEKAIELVGNSDTPSQIALRAMLIEFGNIIMNEVKDKLDNCKHGYGYEGCRCEQCLFGSDSD